MAVRDFYLLTTTHAHLPLDAPAQAAYTYGARMFAINLADKLGGPEFQTVVDHEKNRILAILKARVFPCT